jgi:hypothetical protein
MDLYKEQFENNNIDYYIILSKPELKKSGKLYELDGNYFYVATEEAYEIIAHKLVIFYEYIYNHTDYDIVIKSDDGCLIDVDKIVNSPDDDYFGADLVATVNKCHYGKCKNKKYNKIGLDFRHKFHMTRYLNKEQRENITKIKYAAGGYGYGLSRKSLENIIKYKTHILKLNFSYEDLLFGQVLYLSNINVKPYRFGKYHKV